MEGAWVERGSLVKDLDNLVDNLEVVEATCSHSQNLAEVDQIQAEAGQNQVEVGLLPCFPLKKN
jgi:hypothetical protein